MTNFEIVYFTCFKLTPVDKMKIHHFSRELMKFILSIYGPERKWYITFKRIYCVTHILELEPSDLSAVSVCYNPPINKVTHIHRIYELYIMRGIFSYQKVSKAIIMSSRSFILWVREFELLRAAHKLFEWLMTREIKSKFNCKFPKHCDNFDSGN